MSEQATRRVPPHVLMTWLHYECNTHHMTHLSYECTKRQMRCVGEKDCTSSRMMCVSRLKCLSVRCTKCQMDRGKWALSNNETRCMGVHRHALTRLDENRAKRQLAAKAGLFYDRISNVAIWGNHSTSQVPDFVNARIEQRPATEVIADDAWFKDEFTPIVATRGWLFLSTPM